MSTCLTFKTKSALTLCVSALAFSSFGCHLAIENPHDDGGTWAPPWFDAGFTLPGDASTVPPGLDAGTVLPGDASTGVPVTPQVDAGPLPTADATVPPAPTPDAGSVTPVEDAAVTPPPPPAPWCAAKAVLDTRCVTCHDGKGTGGSPYGLTSYADVAKEAPGRPGVTIATRIGVRVHPEKAQAEYLGVMPPGRPIPAEELAAIDAWLAAGASNGTCD